MVQDRYWLPPRKAFLCRMPGNLFLFSAAAMLVVIAFAGLTPGAYPYCGEGGCSWNTLPARLLDSQVREAVEATPAAMRAFETHASRPTVRLALAAADAIDSLPFGVLLLSVGLALRRLGAQGADALAQALPWLRRASLAAIAWTALDPVHEGAVEAILSAGTPKGASISLSFYLGDIASGLLLAMAAYAAIWAMEAGLRSQRDLDGFV